MAGHLTKAQRLRFRLDPGGANKAPGWTDTAERVPGAKVLAYREREIVILAASGKTSKVIAHELGIKDTTVRVLLARAAMKLGVKSRNELFEHPAVRALIPPTTHND